MKFFLKKYMLVIIILIAIPLISLLAFVISEYCLHKIDLKAGEWASFIGAILSYLGTAFLGLLALWQNEKANEVNKNILNYQLISNSYSIIEHFTEVEINFFYPYDTSLNLINEINHLWVKDKVPEKRFYFIEFQILFDQYKNVLPNTVKIKKLTIDYSPISKPHSKFLDAVNESNKFYRIGKTDKNDKVLFFYLLYGYNDISSFQNIKDIENESNIFLEISLEYKNAFNIVTDVELGLKLKNYDNNEMENSVIRKYKVIQSFNYDYKFHIDETA
jgi:hypothetical protein